MNLTDIYFLFKTSIYPTSNPHHLRVLKISVFFNNNSANIKAQFVNLQTEHTMNSIFYTSIITTYKIIEAYNYE